MKSFIVICALSILSIQGAVAESCAKPPFLLRPDECCAIPRPPGEEGVIKNCMEKYGEHTMRIQADYSGEGPMRGCCVAECIVNATGLRDAAPEKMRDMAAKFLATMPEWDGVPDILLSECSKAYVAKKALLEEGNNLPPLKPDDPHCHPRFGFKMMCEIKTFLTHCPAQHRKDSDDCKKIFDFYKNCEL